MQLTDEQHSIVSHVGGHALVSAVAGSGKTTTMVARIRHLLEQGCGVREMLVLMFNRSARNGFAASLKEYLSGTKLSMPDIRTFHALGLRLTESFVKRGVLPAYRLVTDDRIREKLAKQVLTVSYKEAHGDHAWPDKEDQEEFLRFIDLVKAGLDSPVKCLEKEKLTFSYSYFPAAYQRFEKERCKSRIRFYEDLIYEPLIAMLNDDSLAGWVSNRVDHIIVDEYQDINEVQQQLLMILAGKRAKVMVVGDVDQCIYEWRGAQPDYITTRFQHDFPDPAHYTLSYTFRYGHRLSLAANHLISRNRKRDRKLCLSSEKNFDTRLELYQESAVHPVINIVEKWTEGGRSLSEAVILVRLFAMSVPVELALLEAEIPYRLEGHEQLFGCREIKALIGYLKLASGELVEEDITERVSYLVAMLSQPHLGIRQEELESLAKTIAVNPQEAPKHIWAQLQRDIPPFIKKKMADIADNWEWLIKKANCSRAERLLADIVSRFDLYEFYVKFSSRLAAAENRIETCRAFISFAERQRMDVQSFLSHVKTLKERSAMVQKDSLLITSIHRAKGLEWPLVILPGLKEGLFPFIDEDGEADNLEDERRLFYVGITRGIERVALIHPVDSFLRKYGVKNGDYTDPVASRFLYEINFDLSNQLGGLIAKDAAGDGGENVLKTETNPIIANDYIQAIGTNLPLIAGAVAPSKPKKKQHSVRIGDLGEGVFVTHKVYGDGVIVKVVNRSQGKINVKFEEYGEKTLLLEYAPLTLTQDIRF